MRTRIGSRLARRGFTLAELIVVIAIIALVATVTVPALASLDHTGAPGGAAASVLSVLQRARRTAIKRGATVTLRLIPATAQYWATIDSADERPVLASAVIPLDAGSTLTAPHERAQWVFFADGRVAGDTLVVHPRNGAAVMIAADPWTGAIRADAR
jgi:type II secretion system protein H